MRMMNAQGMACYAAAWLTLAAATLPAMAGSADSVAEDTMIVIEQGALPEDIINVIRLPEAATERGADEAPTRPRGAGDEVAAGADSSAREAAAEIAEQARSRGAEIAEDARERAADMAESMREAAEDMREELALPVGPPTDLDLPEQAEGPP
jgi:vacuolar-type H+-ATPase subunit H